MDPILVPYGRTTEIKDKEPDNLLTLPFGVFTTVVQGRMSNDYA